jgi:hypothetical protein
MPSGEIVEISLKQKSYLKEYFIHQYGQEPITASIRNKLFPFLAKYLTHRPKGWKPPVSKNDNLLIELPYSEHINVRALNYISPKHFSEIRSFLYGRFYGDFITYMNEKHHKYGWQKKYAIIRFIDDNNMNWDKADYETLKKIYDRYLYPERDKKTRKNNKKVLQSGGRK